MCAPDVCLCHVIRNKQRVLEAAERHVVLRSMEAAEPQVVPELGIRDPHHQQAPVCTSRH